MSSCANDPTCKATSWRAGTDPATTSCLKCTAGLQFLRERSEDKDYRSAAKHWPEGRCKACGPECKHTNYTPVVKVRDTGCVGSISRGMMSLQKCAELTAYGEDVILLNGTLVACMSTIFEYRGYGQEGTCACVDVNGGHEWSDVTGDFCRKPLLVWLN